MTEHVPPDKRVRLAGFVHEAKYVLSPADLAELLGIKIPDGATIAIEHARDGSATASPRVTSIPGDHKLIIRVKWEGETWATGETA